MKLFEISYPYFSLIRARNLDHNRQSRQYKGSRRSRIALERVNSLILLYAIITCLLLAKVIGDFLLVYLK